MARAAAEQVPLSFSKRGGARLGAGRPRKKDGGPSHRTRPQLSGREPVHVSIRLCDDVLRLRSRRCFSIVCAALAATCNREGFRVVGCSVQDSHLHLLIEAASADSLSRGMQALQIRVAKGLNKLMGRKGKVFRERYFPHVLATPEEVRRAQAYVFGNRANHLARRGRRLVAGFRDRYTLGHFGATTALPSGGPPLVVEPRTWLLRNGWRRARSGSSPDTGAVLDPRCETRPPGPAPLPPRSRSAGRASPGDGGQLRLALGIAA